MAGAAAISRRTAGGAAAHRAALGLSSAFAAAVLTSWSVSRLPLAPKLAELALCVVSWEVSIAACRAAFRRFCPAGGGSASMLAVMVLAAAVPALILSAGALAAVSETIGRPVAFCCQSVALGLLLAFARRGLAARRPAPAVPAAAVERPCPQRAGAAFLRCHAPQLAGGRLLALAAEDHYLRIHAERGSTLILMRLKDAVAALGPEAGWQTHRSFWIACGAGAEPQRQGKAWAMVFPGGLSVPVSRANVARLRGDGVAP